MIKQTMNCFFLVGIALMVTGCHSALDGMKRNDFVGVKPQPIPADMVGTWTGSLGPGLLTFVWRENGEGFVCGSSFGKDSIEKTKYADGEIVYSSGVRQSVTASNGELYKVSYKYAGSRDEFTFYRDQDLKHASPTCIESIKKLKQ